MKYILIEDNVERSFYVNNTAVFYNIKCKTIDGSKKSLELYGEKIYSQTLCIPSNPVFSTGTEILNLVTEKGTAFFNEYIIVALAYSKKDKKIIIHQVTVKNGYEIEYD
jgi:hypothetical protein